VAILNHGKLVLAGPVDAITRGGREFQITLSRPLQIQERDALESIRGVRQIKDLTETAAPQPTNPTGPASYLVTLDLTDETLHEDDVLAALLRNLLDRDITPRKITDGRSLETHFLELTNSSNPAT